MKKWRIAFLVPGDIRSLTGGYIYDTQLLEYLQRQEKYTVQLFATPKPRVMFDFLYNFWLLVLIANRFDAVIEDGMAFRQTFLFNQLCKLLIRRTSLIGIIHMIFSPIEKREYARRITRIVEGRWMNSLDTIVVNSQNTLLETRKQLRGKNNRIIVASPGCKINYEALQTRLLDLNTSDEKEVTILYVGQVISRKGLHLLLEALTSLADLHWRLNVVGDMGCDENYANQIRNLVEKIGLKDKVKLFGELSRANVTRMLEVSDVFVSVSMYEAFGMSALEALAVGIPVIAFATGGLTETVEHNVTGLLVRPGDIEGLTRALYSIITNTTLRLDLSRKAKERMDRLPTWEATCSLIEGNLIQILSAKEA